MSIINAINNAKVKIAAAYTALRNKGATIPSNQNLDNLASSIESIDTSGLDTSDANAVPSDILVGKTAYVNGNKITGNIPSIQANTFNPSTETKIIQKGYYLDGDLIINAVTASNIPSSLKETKEVTPNESEQTVNPSNGKVLNSVKVNAIQPTFVGSSIPRKTSADVTNDGPKINVPSGYYSNNVTYHMDTINPPILDISVDANGLITATESHDEGYTEENINTETYQMNVKKATIYNPSTTEQIIPSGTYLTGEQKIAAITADNIPNSLKMGIVVTPTERTQTLFPFTNMVITEVEVNAIPTNYVGSGVTKKNSINIVPTKSEQIAVAKGVYTIGDIKVDAIPSDYIIPNGSQTITENKTYDVRSLASIIVDVASDGGLPTGITAIDFGTINIATQFTTTKHTFNHSLGVTPDLMIVWHEGNIATTYSMLCAIRGNDFGWRSSAYNNHYAYHGNSTTTVTWTNSNSTSYGISNMTATTFQLASLSSSYYWRAGMYNYIAIKFN